MSAAAYVVVETAIAVAFSVAFNVGMSWLVLHAFNPITLMGLPGLAVGLVPATFMTCLMVTLASTLITRARRKRGRTPAVLPARTWLPRPALVRGLVVGLLATLVFTPFSIGLLYVARPGPYSLLEAVAINGVYSIVLALLIAPPLLRIALGEAGTGAASQLTGA